MKRADQYRCVDERDPRLPAPGTYPPSVPFDALAGRGPIAERVHGDRFFGAAPPPDEPEPAETWASSEWKLAFALTAAGVVGVLIWQAAFLQQVVVGAPVFEEMLKFGVALLTVLALRVRPTFARWLIALAWGAGFGVFEHYSTYPDEPTFIFVDRVFFHAGATGLSMVTLSVVRPLWDARARWLTTVPATFVHWLNNFFAVVLGIGGLVAGDAIGYVAMGFTAVVSALTFILTVVVAVRRRHLRAFIAFEWRRRFGTPKGRGATRAPLYVVPEPGVTKTAEAGAEAANPAGAPRAPDLASEDTPEARPGDRP